MSIRLKRILVPIDFSVNAEIALKKTVSLADEEATIHLLHVSHINAYRKHFLNLTGASENAWRSKTVGKLNEYKHLVHQSSKQLFVKVWITRHWSTQVAIENKAKALAAELIVSGQTNNYYLGPLLHKVIPANLARRTGAAVLVVHPESETRVNWLNEQSSDMLPTTSKVEVLAVRQDTMLT